MITFSQLNQGDKIHVLEVTGTFKKSTSYCLGTIQNVTVPYEEQITTSQFSVANQLRRKLVDITIACDGEQKKLTVEEGKSIITDSQIGLTVATEKQHITDMVKRTYDEYKSKKEAISKYDEEMSKCESILKQLGYEEGTQEDHKIKELQEQVNELKNIIKQAGSMLPQQMLQSLPQNMQNAIEEAN